MALASRVNAALLPIPNDDCDAAEPMLFRLSFPSSEESGTDPLPPPPPIPCEEASEEEDEGCPAEATATAPKTAAALGASPQALK